MKETKTSNQRKGPSAKVDMYFFNRNHRLIRTLLTKVADKFVHFNNKNNRIICILITLRN